MKTAVEAVFTGKERHYNRRFLQMCSHYLVQPVACTPASGWEKGQVENQVGLVRERFFTPRLRVKSLDELNAWQMDKCVADAKAHRHPEEADKTIWEMFEAEPAHLVPYVGRFDGFHSVPAPVSKTCTVRFDPPAMAAIRRQLKGSDDGDRKMVQIQSRVPDDGLQAVEAACREAVDQGVHFAPVVINILARRRAPTPPPLLLTPTALRLTHEPVADCARYDSLRRPSRHGTHPNLRPDEQPQALRDAQRL